MLQEWHNLKVLLHFILYRLSFKIKNETLFNNGCTQESSWPGMNSIGIVLSFLCRKKNLALAVDQFKQQSTKDFHTKLLGYGFSNQIICNETDESRNILKLLTLEYIARQKNILFWKRHQIAFHSCQIKDSSLLLQAPNYSNLISNELTAHIMCSPHKYFILHDPNKYIFI